MNNRMSGIITDASIPAELITGSAWIRLTVQLSQPHTMQQEFEDRGTVEELRNRYGYERDSNGEYNLSAVLRRKCEIEKTTEGYRFLRYI